MDIDEHQLLGHAKAGDEGALEELLLRYYDRLAVGINRRLPVSLRPTVSAEDILQQAFVDAFRGIGAFEPEGRFAFFRWLSTITRHRLLDAIERERAAKRGGGRIRQAAGSESFDDLLECLVPDVHTPSRSFSRKEAGDVVMSAMKGLHADYRRVLQLRFLEGRSVEETAQVMNTDSRAVYNLCHRALRKLRTLLGASTDFFSRK